MILVILDIKRRAESWTILLLIKKRETWTILLEYDHSPWHHFFMPHSRWNPLANLSKAEILELIDTQQFGNPKETSNSHYLVSLLGTILRNLENLDTWWNLLLISLQKAYDLTDNNILVNNLLTVFQVSPFLVCGVSTSWRRRKLTNLHLFKQRN